MTRSWLALFVMVGLCLGARKPPGKKSATSQPTKTIRLSGAHILISYRGADKSTATRSKGEAYRLALRLTHKAMARPKDFAKLARLYSDAPSASRGGHLGTWSSGQHPVLKLDASMIKLSVGQVSYPQHTRFGYHVILRKATAPRRAAAHILISYKGARRSRSTVTRSRAQARKLARRLLWMVRAKPANFAQCAKSRADSRSESCARRVREDNFAKLARKYSDGPTARRGGDLGVWEEGRMVPRFEEAVGKLSIGQVGVVGTQFGCHVVLRKAVH